MLTKTLNDLEDTLRKRPLVRPLFFWIVGILLYYYLSMPWLMCGLAIFIILLSLWLILSKIGSAHGRPYYEMRWVWGVFISILTIALAVEVSLFAYKRAMNRLDNVSPLQERATQIQQTLVNEYDSLSLTDEEKSVLATLTLGYRRSMKKETRHLFSLAGVSHILAVSGFHVAVVCGVLSFLSAFFGRWRIGRWIRYLLLMSGVWSFAFITGMAPSAMRAALMLSLYLTSRQLRRDTDGYHTLSVAAFCMLVYNPFYLFDIGFQLSYLAVLAILFLTPYMKRLIEVKNPLLAMPMNWIFMSLAAQIGTAWLCFYYFRQISIVFLFTNIPIMLLTTILIPLTFFWMVYPTEVVGHETLQHAVELLVHAMMRVVQLFGIGWN